MKNVKIFEYDITACW